MRWLVTGGCGFIGGHVVRQLVSQQSAGNVYVMDARTRAATQAKQVRDWLGDNLLHGSVTSPDDVRRAVGESHPDVVLHLAAQSHVDSSLRDPNEAMLTNAYGTQVVATACAQRGIPLVYCSTDEVYGPAQMRNDVPVPYCEGAAMHPSSPYSAGKAAGEHSVRAMGISAGLRYAITRGCNAFGSGQLAEKLVPIACALLQRGEPVPLHGGGAQLRQWVSVTEFADALVFIADGLQGGDLMAGQTYNIAGPRVCSVRELVLALAAVAGVPAERAIRSTVERPGQDAAYCIDGALLSMFGWRARTDILDTDNLRAMLASYAAETRVHLAPYTEQSL